MKNLFFLTVMLCALPLSMQAQYDDMYFVPKKKAADKVVQSTVRPVQERTYYSGSSRNVDEYNRRGSYYQPIAGDTTMTDVISFSGEEGFYPDSISGDFALTKKMTRFEGYTPTDAYWEGYDRGRSDEWAATTWHSPWYYSSYYPWYDRWGYYDPWYYSSWNYGPWGWHYSWYYDPWYYRPYHYGGYYHYYDRPHYSVHGGSGGYYRPSTGTQSHGRIINSGRRYGTSSGIGAGRGSAVQRGNGSVGAGRSSSGSLGTRSSSGGSYTPSRASSGSSIGSSRSSSGSYTPSRSSGGSSIGSSRSSSGGSFGGSRSGGGSRSAGRR